MKETALPRGKPEILSESFVALLRLGAVASVVVASSSTIASASILKPSRVEHRDLLALVGPRITSPIDWWFTELSGGNRFGLEQSSALVSSINRFRFVEQPAPWDYRRAVGRCAPWVTELYWHVDFNETPSFGDDDVRFPAWFGQKQLPALPTPAQPRLSPFETIQAEPALGLTALLEAPRPTIAPITRNDECPSGPKPRSIAFEGLGGEGVRIALVDCNGVVTLQALERLSVLGRQPGTHAPPLPLPLVPTNDPQVDGEWVNGVRLLHPRLLWQLQQISLAFPWRSIVLYSGYRRDARSNSRHLRGRAVDIEVIGVAKERLFAFCRTLQDVGCGYYPHQPFVHVDVRSPTEGSGYWVDISEPGHPSNYVDSWPGVVSNGALESSSAD